LAVLEWLNKPFKAQLALAGKLRVSNNQSQVH